MAEAERDGTALKPARGEGGKWLPGVSPNPGGMPSGFGELRRLARQYAGLAIETLAEIMQDKTASKPARVAAADAILDRGFGKPQQTLDLGGSEWAALGAASLAALLASLPEAVRARYALMAAATGEPERQVIDITPPESEG